MIFVILVSCYITILVFSLLAFLYLLFEWTFIVVLSTLIYLDLFYNLLVLHVTLFYSILLLSSILFLNWYSLLCFALFHCALLCFMLYFSFCFSSAFHFTLFVLRISRPFRSLYALFYPTLYFHSTVFPFTLHCFVSLHYLASFTLFRTIALCFPYFSWSSFCSDFNFTFSWSVSCPSIPYLTCFVEPRTILLPLILLCSISHEPGALEKSDPNWQRYVIYSPCRNETERAGRPSDFTQCILIADLMLRHRRSGSFWRSTLKIDSTRNHAKRKDRSWDTIISILFSMTLSPRFRFSHFQLSVFRDIFHNSFRSFISVSFIWISTFSSFLHVLPRVTFFLISPICRFVSISRVVRDSY